MGLVHIYCGDGKGKTTACVGLSVRAAGSGMKVLFVQFFKNGNSSEIKVLKSIDNIECLHAEKPCGRFSNMSDEQKMQAKDDFENLLNTAIEKSKDVDMVVFDEAISTYNYNMIDKQQFIDFIKNHRQHLEIVLSGRDPSDELLSIADYVSEIRKIKHPFDEGMKARKGIEF
jgi:cob(I)alamin adenosyltransferase